MWPMQKVFAQNIFFVSKSKSKLINWKNPVQASKILQLKLSKKCLTLPKYCELKLQIDLTKRIGKLTDNVQK